MNRKIYLYLCCTAGLTLAAACSQDLTYTGEYDIKSYYSGSDPRASLLAFSKKAQTLTLPYIGNVCLQEKAEVNLDMRATCEVTQNEKLSLEVVNKENPLVKDYEDLHFITAEQVSVDAPSAIWPTGSITHTSKLSVDMKGVPNGAVLPIKLGLEQGSQMRVSEGNALQVIKIEGKQVVSLNKQVFEIGVAVTPNGVEVEGEGKITLAALSSVRFNGYQVKIVRDDAIVKAYPGRLKGYEIAPDNLFPKFEARNFDNTEEVDLSFQIPNISNPTTNKKIVLPLKLVLIDKEGKQMELLQHKGDILVQIEYFASDVEITENEAELGTALPKMGWTISSTPPTSSTTPLSVLLDNTENGEQWYSRVPNNGHVSIKIDMKQNKSIKGFKFSNLPDDSYSPDPSPESYHFFISENGQDWQSISKVIRGNVDEGSYLFKTLKAYNTRYLLFQLTADLNNYVGLTEITVYGD